MSFSLERIFLNIVDEAICRCNCFYAHNLVFQRNFLFHYFFDLLFILMDIRLLILKFYSSIFDLGLLFHADLDLIYSWCWTDITELNDVIFFHSFPNRGFFFRLLFLNRCLLPFFFILLQGLLLSHFLLNRGRKWILKLVLLGTRGDRSWRLQISPEISIDPNIWFFGVG